MVTPASRKFCRPYANRLIVEVDTEAAAPWDRQARSAAQGGTPSGPDTHNPAVDEQKRKRRCRE